MKRKNPQRNLETKPNLDPHITLSLPLKDLRYAIVAILEAQPSLIPVMEKLIGSIVPARPADEIEEISISAEEAEASRSRIEAQLMTLETMGTVEGEEGARAVLDSL